MLSPRTITRKLLKRDIYNPFCEADSGRALLFQGGLVEDLMS